MAIENSDKEVLQHCITWLQQGHNVELVTVAKTWGSSPRPPGSLAAVREDGVLVGSVSGGCIEKQLAESFKGQDTNRVILHRINDADARRFGLACGGQLELVFETLSDPAPLVSLLRDVDSRHRVRRTVTLGDNKASVSLASRTDTFSFDGSSLSKIYGPSWQVLIIGAGQLSRYTAEFALALDFDVLVCEPRPEFQAAWNVIGAHLLTVEPHVAVLEHGTDLQTAVLALTHDPNLDDMALLEALPGNSFYVGALGSKNNYARRCKRLAALHEAHEIDRLPGPVGLKIGSRTSAEIALSIMAEVVLERATINEARSNAKTL